MSKHTPGPWWFAGMEIGTVPNMDIKVARVSGANLEEARANGRLMAAAPKLLAALEIFADPEIIAQLEGCAEDGVRRTDDEDWAKFRLLAKHYRAAAAAVAEAKGGQP